MQQHCTKCTALTNTWKVPIMNTWQYHCGVVMETSPLFLCLRCSLVQSLHVYDYSCNWKWNKEELLVVSLLRIIRIAEYAHRKTPPIYCIYFYLRIAPSAPSSVTLQPPSMLFLPVRFRSTLSNRSTDECNSWLNADWWGGMSADPNSFVHLSLALEMFLDPVQWLTIHWSCQQLTAFLLISQHCILVSRWNTASVSWKGIFVP